MITGILLTLYITKFTMDTDVEESQTISEVDKTDESDQIYDSEELLYKAFWEIFEGESDWAANKGLAIDLSNYRIIKLQVNKSWSVNHFVGGNMDVIMQNIDSGLYDWLTFELLLSDGKLVNMELAHPSYYAEFNLQSPDIQDEIEQFVRRVFDTMAPMHFGYRYRSSLSIPIKWNIEDVEVLGSNDDVFFVQINYGADYADTQKLLKALLVIKHYENRKYQIEDIQVIG